MARSGLHYGHFSYSTIKIISNAAWRSMYCIIYYLLFIM